VSALTFVQLRQAVVAKLAAMTPPTGVTWTQSPYLYDLFARDPSTTAHGAWALGMPTSLLTKELRNQDAQGGWVDTEFHLKFTTRVAPKDQNTSFETALAIEHAVIKQIHTQSSTWPLDFRMWWSGTSTRGLVAGSGEWLVTDIPFLVKFHLLPLS
jgi:hypothetical protein